jgi:hypothetical protein
MLYQLQDTGVLWNKQVINELVLSDSRLMIKELGINF